MKDGAQKFATVDNVLYNVSDDEAVMVVYPGGKPETEYTIPTEVNGKAVTSTAMHLFRNNSVLKKVTVPGKHYKLGWLHFNGRKAIEEIVLEHENSSVNRLGNLHRDEYRQQGHCEKRRSCKDF